MKTQSVCLLASLWLCACQTAVNRPPPATSPRPSDSAAFPGEGARQTLRYRNFSAGYAQGKADTIKQLYWDQEHQQLQQTNSPAVELYPVLIPEHTEDGAVVQPTVRVITIAR